MVARSRAPAGGRRGPAPAATGPRPGGARKRTQMLHVRVSLLR